MTYLCRVLVYLFVINYGSLLSASTDSGIKTESHVLKSKLGVEYSLTVILPPHYDPNSSAKYPVFYQLDGKNYADIYSRLLEALGNTDDIPRMIYIGIDTQDRFKYFTPHEKDSKSFHEESGVQIFIAGLKNEIIPFVESKYHCESYRILSGHSLGGLAVYETFLTVPMLFNAYFAFDSSLWFWDKHQTDVELSNLNSINKSIFFYANYGGKSVSSLDMYEGNMKYNKLIRNSIPKIAKISESVDEMGSHMSIPYSGLIHGLKELFFGFKLSENEIKSFQSPIDYERYLKDLSQRFGIKIDVKEMEVLYIAENSLHGKNPLKALAFAKYGKTKFPKNPDFLYLMGDAYKQSGNVDLGKEEIESACHMTAELNPSSHECRDPMKNEGSLEYDP